MTTLVGLSYSPWTLKARWALDHHAVHYTYREHLPMIGEPILRLARLAGGLRSRTLESPFERVSVPMLFEDGGASHADSFNIALLAERTGAGAPLFPEGSLDTIRAFNERSEAALEAARALVIARTVASKEALIEALPPLLPASLRPSLTPIAATGALFLAKKYGSGGDLAAAEEAFASELDQLQKALGGRTYLLDGFSYADITMAVVLQAVSPVSDRWVRLKPATREVWTSPNLTERYRDLITWRDELYQKHR